MFRVLLVEDDGPTVEVLMQLLKLHFTSADDRRLEPQLDVAFTVAQAKELIEQAAKPYHAVILDFKLPARPGANAEVDESLCLTLKRKMPAAVVGHITSHPEDKLVQEHLQHYHYESVNNAFALSKLDKDYTRKLTRNLKTALYGQRIEAQLNRIFGAGTAPAGATCLTHDLADLCYDIVAFWPDLDAPLQDRVKRHFYVNEDSQPIGLSLL